MASKRRLRRKEQAQVVRSCGNKKKHASESDAGGQLMSMRRSGKDTSRMHAYKCGHCGTWHVGHKKTSDTQARLKRLQSAG